MKDAVPEPICSICIANYNGAGVIEACIRSVLQQDGGIPVEIIVHDDASTDNSVNFIKNGFPEVILLKSEANLGFCVSNNKMALRARGKYILFLNNDAELYPDAIMTLYKRALNKPNAVLGLPQFNAANGQLIDRGQFLDIFLNPIPNLNSEIENVGMVTGACLWIPKQVWNEIGGFPGWFHSFAEDLYICCMARLKGHPVRIVNRSGYRHWVGTSYGGGKVQHDRLSTSLRRRALSERNKTFVMLMGYPTPLFQIVFPFHLLFLLVEGSILSIIKRDNSLFLKIYVNVFSSIYTNKKKLSTNRKNIQRNRTITSRSFLAVFRIIPHKLKLAFVYGIPEIK